jgi:hypothetical protein
MPDEMNTRMSSAEWKIEALKEGHRQQNTKMAITPCLNQDTAPAQGTAASKGG